MKSRLTIFCIKVSLKPSRYLEFKRKCKSSAYPLACDKLPLDFPISQKLFHKYLNQKISYNKKLFILNSHIDFIDQKIKSNVIDELYDPKHQGIKLADIEGKNETKISLHLTAPLYPREGDLRVMMRLDEKMVFSIHFTITLSGDIYIAGVQGHAGNEVLKQLTKDFFGFRPKNLIATFLFEIANFFKIEHIYGVKSQAHVKVGKFEFDYDEYWRELNGESYNKAWFKLPAVQPRKPIESIKSSKRSEFKKREQIRDDIAAQCQKSLQSIIN